jgi:hypothetical protein
MKLLQKEKKQTRKETDERPKVNIHRSFTFEKDLKEILYSVAILKMKENKTAEVA